MRSSKERGTSLVSFLMPHNLDARELREMIEALMIYLLSDENT